MSGTRRILVLAVAQAAVLAALTPPAVVGLSVLAQEWGAAADAPALLSVALACGSIAAMLSNPLFGRLVDRTPARLGGRRPWLVLGAVGGLAGSAWIVSADGALEVTLAWVATQASYNASFAAVNGLISVRLRPEHRTRAAGILTAVAYVGTLPGLAIAALFAADIAMMLLVLPVGALAVTAIVALVVADAPADGGPTAAQQLRSADPSADRGPVAAQQLRSADPSAERGPVAAQQLRSADPSTDRGPVAAQQLRSASPSADRGPVAAQQLRSVDPSAERGPVAAQHVRSVDPFAHRGPVRRGPRIAEGSTVAGADAVEPAARRHRSNRADVAAGIAPPTSPAAPRGDLRALLTRPFLLAFAVRFALATELAAGLVYGLYLFQERWGMPVADAVRWVSLTTLAGAAGLVTAAVVLALVRSSRERHALLLGVAVLGTTAAMLGRGFAPSPQVFLVASVVAGIAIGIGSTVTRAIVQGALPHDRAAFGLGVFNVASTASAVIAPLVASAFLAAGSALLAEDAYRAYYVLFAAPLPLLLIPLMLLRSSLRFEATAVADEATAGAYPPAGR